MRKFTGMEPIMMITNAASREVVSSPRYIHDIGELSKPRVIVQRTRKGYGCYASEAGERRVSEGFAFVIIVPERARYFYPKEACEPWLIDWADFSGPLAISLFREFKEQFGPVVSLPMKGSAGILFSRLIARAETESFNDRREVSQAVYAFLLEWWREAAQSEEGGRLLEIVNACTGAGVGRLTTIKELASECGMSREHFTRTFTRQTGVPPAEWLRQQRLTAAAESLRQNPSLTIGAVARETGFATARHLSASFRRAYGITIDAYRSESASTL